MEDPTRIPGVLAELRETWEAQPELGLPTLWAQLENAGLGWGADDDELVAALRAMRRRRPAFVDAATLAAHPGRLFQVRLRRRDGARGILSLGGAPGTAVLRWEDGQPVRWRHGGLPAVRVAAPCRIEDAGGVTHRLGMVEGITAARRPRPPRGGLTRADVGDRSWLLELAEPGTVEAAGRGPGRVALLGAALEVWQPGNRELGHERRRWARLESCAVGGALRTVRGPGAPVEDHGTVLGVIPFLAGEAMR